MATKGKVAKLATRKKKIKKNKDGERSFGLSKEVKRNDISKDTKTTIWMSENEHIEFKIEAMREGIPLYEHLYNLIMLGQKVHDKKKAKEETETEETE